MNCATVWKNNKFSLAEKNSSNQLFSDFFSKTIAFTKFFQKKCERIALWKSWKFTLTPFWQKIRESNVFTAPQCRNSGNSLSHLFDKKFVKITFLLKKKLLKRRFHEIFFQWERMSRFSTLPHSNHANLLPSHHWLLAYYVKEWI